jgi:hypothetical protein
MLTVIENEQRPARLEILDERVPRSPTRQLPQAHGTDYRSRHKCGILQPRKLDPPHPVEMAVHRAGGCLQCQARLTTTARAGERQQPHLPEQLSDLRQLRAAPDEARQLTRQIVGQGTQRPQRREPDRQIGVQQPEHVFRPANITKPVHAQI